MLSTSDRSPSDRPASDTEPIFDHIYLHNMPLAERNELCTILDEQNIWEDLAYRVGYTKNAINNIKHRAKDCANFSPSDEFLNLWSEQNHTVTELFMVLNGMQQYPAMESIRNLVNPQYHRLILSGQPDLCALLSNQSLASRRNTDMNKNRQSEKILNGPELSYEENESNATSSDDKIGKDSESVSYDINNINEFAMTIPQIEYKELAEATEKWNAENVLGRGGFGTVFKGMWKCTAVAIKRIEYHGADPHKNTKIQMQQSLNELRYLNSCRHDNILPLYGYSMDGKEPCLVYQFMSGGSLERRLSDKIYPLTLYQRLNIAVGTARGLQYLHTFNKKPLLHGDIKPANILLDPCSQPKIGDFGLAREGLMNSSMEVSRVYGTKPYLPMEFLENHTLSTKVDTYSFGVVLFELATGLRAYAKERGVANAFLSKHIRLCAQNAVSDIKNLNNLMDKTLERTNECLQVFTNMIRLGLICTNEKPSDRPEMVTVLHYLAN